MKYLDENGLLYYNQKLKEKLNDKVDKVEGKGLSTNDLTDELKQKILNAGDSSFSGNYPDLNNKPTLDGEVIQGTLTKEGLGIASKEDLDALETSVETNTTDINEIKSAGYQTEDDVTNAIGEAISNITSIDFEIVDSLPETGQKGIIYLVSNSGSTPNIYDEYIYVNNGFEKIGTTDIDLSGYVKKTDLTEITNSEIDTIVGE